MYIYIRTCAYGLHMLRRIKLWSFDTRMLIRFTLTVIQGIEHKRHKKFSEAQFCSFMRLKRAQRNVAYLRLQVLRVAWAFCLINQLCRTIYYSFSDKLYFTSFSVIGEVSFYNYQNISSMSRYTRFLLIEKGKGTRGLFIFIIMI